MTQVFFDISGNNNYIGRLVFLLRDDVAPRTVENFKSLCIGYNGLTYKNSIFHRIIPNFMCQGGDITNGNGTGGMSIYGRNFNDENFILKHTEPGILSMANAGPNTNSSQFFITTIATPWLDNRHVVFGKLVSGFEVLKMMESAGTNNGNPTMLIKIIDCGLL